MRRRWRVELDLAYTAGVAGLGVAMIAWAVWREGRPRQTLNVSLIPTTPIMFAGIIVILLALVHLLGIYGIKLPQRRM